MMNRREANLAEFRSLWAQLSPSSQAEVVKMMEELTPKDPKKEKPQ